MNNVVWLITLVAALLAGWGGLQKRKASEATKRAKAAEAESARTRLQMGITQVATGIKDELIGKQRENAAKQEEVIQAIDGSEKKEDPHEKAKQQEQIVKDLNAGFNSRRRP